MNASFVVLVAFAIAVRYLVGLGEYSGKALEHLFLVDM